MTYIPHNYATLQYNLTRPLGVHPHVTPGLCFFGPRPGAPHVLRYLCSVHHVPPCLHQGIHGVGGLELLISLQSMHTCLMGANKPLHGGYMDILKPLHGELMGKCKTLLVG